MGRNVTEKGALDLFGALLLRNVRDRVVQEWDATINGDSKAPALRRLHEEIASSLGADQLGLLRRLVPWIVDDALHHLLWTLETERGVEVAVRGPSGRVSSIRDASDGLSGELYGESGWLARFSQERHEDYGNL